MRTDEKTLRQNARVLLTKYMGEDIVFLPAPKGNYYD